MARVCLAFMFDVFTRVYFAVAILAVVGVIICVVCSVAPVVYVVEKLRKPKARGHL